MEIVIEHKDTKRRIAGAFNICASREDFIKIADAINSALKESRLDYGWINVEDRQKSNTNTAPVGWEAQG